MKLIKPSFEIYDSDPSLKGIFRAIEKAGRTCYKSVGTRYFKVKNEPKNEKLIEELKKNPEVKCVAGPFFDNAYYVSIPNKFITSYPKLEESWEEDYNDCAYYENLTAEPFVKSLMKNGHGAMLEHGTVYLKISYTSSFTDDNYLNARDSIAFFSRNKYSKVVEKTEDPSRVDNYITTNYRVIWENQREQDLKYLCEPTEFHEKRVTVRFTCNRQISHEFVRHRVFSFGQESTRYCNYTKNKFGEELTFINPCWLTTEELPNKNNIKELKAKTEVLHYFQNVENSYFKLIEFGWLPQQAATILPNALKTELVMTGFIKDWKHFFDLRALGTTGAPHPQAKELALPLYEEFKKRELI